jgi:hypothetical protein
LQLPGGNTSRAQNGGDKDCSDAFFTAFILMIFSFLIGKIESLAPTAAGVENSRNHSYEYIKMVLPRLLSPLGCNEPAYACGGIGVVEDASAAQNIGAG